MNRVKEDFKRFLLEKIKENTNPQKPYYILKWTGLFELARSLGLDLVEIVDQMAKEGIIRKALLPTKTGKRLLAVALPEYSLSSKSKALLEEFLKFQGEKE